MGLLKYALLVVGMALAQPSIGAVIKLGPGCNLYQAIKAANADRRVGRCRPGKGPDTIAAGAWILSHARLALW